MSHSITNNSGKISKAAEEALSRALEICGGMAESYAKALCPVDTGNLRNSITHKQEDTYREAVGTNVEYAPFVELGTYKMKARPFIRPACEDHRSEYRTVIERELKHSRD